MLLSGEGVTDADGKLQLTLPADLLVEIDPGSQGVIVEATVTDVTKTPISARSEVIFHAAEDYVGVRPLNYITTVGTEMAVELITVDWDGLPRGNRPVEVIFYQREWIPIRAREFGQYTTRWEVEDTEVDRTGLTTDQFGKGQASFTPDSGGIYLAVAIVTDDNDRTQMSSTTMWVADSRFGGWRNDSAEKRMDLVADRQEYRPGDTASILVQSPFTGPVSAWVTVERGRMIEQRLVNLDTSSELIDVCPECLLICPRCIWCERQGSLCRYQDWYDRFERDTRSSGD